MKRTIRGSDDPRYDRWGFDDPAPVAPKAREDLIAPQAREEPIAPHDDRAASAREPIRPQPQDELPHRAPPPRPSNPAASPWRKIQIPDEERQRAALAGLHRYVGKAPNETGARRPLPVAARFAAPREDVPPEPAHDSAEDAAMARAAAVRARHAHRPATSPAVPPAIAQGNPRLGLTVGVIVGLSLMAAVGLSWVAAPPIDAAPPQRADLLQSFSPQMVEPSAGLARPTTPDALIEVAPTMPARPATASAVQPIEVAP